MIGNVALIGYADGRWYPGVICPEDMDEMGPPPGRPGRGVPWWRFYLVPIEDEV